MLLCALITYFFLSKENQAKSIKTTSSITAVTVNKAENNDQLPQQNQEDLPQVKPSKPIKNASATVNSDKQKHAWAVNVNNPIVEENGIHVGIAKMDTDLLANLSLEQTLVVDIPHNNERYQVKLNTTYNFSDSVEVWEGKIENGQPYERISIHRGKKQAYISVSTTNGLYTATVNPSTGVVKITNDSEITHHKNQGKVDVMKATAFTIPAPTRKTNNGGIE
ncbi:hypothetical protein [Zooshikella harenae]|uniref:Uncharacterized protein n=1 Tax=Zooshikella harenae TaxID=2827238 RepID=A0ABS5ZJE3_9GAMM|nr:hypothetical protein [Zooshikella harenae]MBU2714201.1 hypothetical protein [Zooshikella harenae]